jgi:Zn-dependent protease
MFGKSVKIFELFGFEVKVDASWLVIATLVTWSLARRVFPHYYEGLPDGQYWFMGIVGALGLFASIVAHEFSHSLVARRYGLPMKGITLFIFGGVAEMHEEPESAKTEFLMAVAGPVLSIVLGGGFYLVFLAGQGSGWPVPVTAIAWYLAFINWLLAGFNLLPAFPLDGGRVLRSALWRWKRDIRWATRYASRVGALFGLVLIILGITNVLAGNPIGGLWWFMIGMFLRMAAQGSYRQVLTKRALEGEKVSRFMGREPVSVPASITVREMVEDYVYKFHFKMYPVTEQGRLAGCISTKDIKKIPAHEWETRTVAEFMNRCSLDNTIGPDADAVDALAKMRRSGNSRLMVVEGDELVGILSLKDVLSFLALKIDLENGGK